MMMASLKTRNRCKPPVQISPPPKPHWTGGTPSPSTPVHHVQPARFVRALSWMRSKKARLRKAAGP